MCDMHSGSTFLCCGNYRFRGLLCGDREQRQSR